MTHRITHLGSAHRHLLPHNLPICPIKTCWACFSRLLADVLLLVACSPPLPVTVSRANALATRDDVMARDGAGTTVTGMYYQ